jgi:hypothetical protein
MARIRTIKPSFFRSEDVSALPLRARLTWIGLWTQCDDAGRTKDNARLIKGDIWPLDEVSLRDIEDDLETLADHGRIVRYEVDGRRYLAITNWRDHQTIQKASTSRYPPPPDDYGAFPVVLPEDGDSPTPRKGREGKGREGRRARGPDDPNAPPRHCPEHEDQPDPPPCGACADARRHREKWDRERAAEAADEQSRRAREQAEANRLAIDACRLCDDRGYLGRTVCTHDPYAYERARNGVAAARAAAARKEP